MNEVTVEKNTLRAAAVGVMAGLALMAGPDTPLRAEPAQASGLTDCEPYFDVTKYRNHQYEVCSAYVGNVAMVALQGFYKFGNNRFTYLSN